MKTHPKEIHEHDWEALNDGETLRVNCSHWRCVGKPNAFTITKIPGGIVYNCYRCGQSGVFFKGRNPKEAIEYLKRLRCNRHQLTAGNVPYSVKLPKDFLFMAMHYKDIPPQAYGWFYIYELNDDDIDNYYIGYSPKLQRAIIPIYSQENKLIAWSGRDVFYKRNKDLYERELIKTRPLKYYTEYASKGRKLYFNIKGTDNKIYLVEDQLSAIKVNNFTKSNVTALLNSTLHKGVINDLDLYKYDKVIIWLDPDKKIESIQGALRWNTLGVNSTYISTDVDPKEVPYNDFNKVVK